MKKLLSIILACAMIMSLFCVVPASADVASSPYVFCTFEDGTSKMSTTTGQALTVVDGGVNNSAKALKIDVTATNVQNGISGMSNTEVHEGDVLTASMWMKLPAAQHETSTGIVSIVFFGKKIEGSGTYKFVTTTFDTQKTDWQKVTWKYVFKEDHTAETVVDNGDGTTTIVGPITSFNIRMNNNGGGNKSIDNTDPENPVASDNCSYLIDDLEIRIGKEYEPEKVYDFTGISTGSSPATAVISTGGLLQTKSAQPDPVDSSNQAFKMQFANRTKVGDSNKPHILGSNYGIINWYDALRSVKTGDKITASFDVYVDSTYFSAADMKVGVTLYPRNASNNATFTEANKYASYIDMSKLDQWQTITFDLGTATADETFYRYYLFVREDDLAPEGHELYQAGTASNENAFVTYMLSETVMYFDNLKVIIESTSDATPTVTDVSATMAADTGIVTPAYTYTTAGATTSADASYFKLLDGNKAIASFAKSDVIVVPEAYRTSANLKLTVVPYSAGGYFGNEVTAAISAAPVVEPIVGINIEKTDDGKILVSTDTELTNAKLIFVTYGANRKMASVTPVNVTLAAQGKEEYEIPAGSTVAMLWLDMTTSCKPLTDAINLN